MSRNWFPILTVAALLALLGVLAWLQYVWLGQVSDGERERLQRVVRSDTERFAEHFNREIQNAYFNFSTGPEVWKTRNWTEINERYKFWREKTGYPELIKNIYFAAGGDAQTLLRYDAEKGVFEDAPWPAALEAVKADLRRAGGPRQIDESIPVLLAPVHEEERAPNQLLLRTMRRAPAGPAAPPPVEPPRFGVVVIELDAEVIVHRLLPDLFKKYFGESAGYHLAVVNSRAETVFQTGEVRAVDAEARLFDLRPDNLFFFANRELLPKTDGERRQSVVIANSRVESTVIAKEPRPEATKKTFTVTTGEVEVIARDGAPRMRVFERSPEAAEGVWTVGVQHAAGSLDQFVANTRRRNLAVSFGILGLLAVSMLLIFVSTQRAKLFARRQIDFVSSVSHEFRTPLAVLYTAGENLADGVAREPAQIERYGNLIKAEGRKLSAMVEQILEFAGARAGKKKYELRAVAPAAIVEKALDECRPLLEEKGFTVETELAGNLPLVSADAAALGQAIENLIANSVKYSNGEKYIRVTARNGGGEIAIAVEDRGIGIAPHDLKHVFEPFYRAKAVVDEQIHGSGLGLSLVKQTVEAHNGRITAESEPGRGSKFTIRLKAIEN